MNEMKTITRTYEMICRSCGGSGNVNPMIFDHTTCGFSSICPVCKGKGVITITEIETSEELQPK